MKQLVFLLEEESMKQMLIGLLPRLKLNCDVKYITFEGKSDLKKQFAKVINLWYEQDAFFIVALDQDSNDCIVLKNILNEMAASIKRPFRIRIVCKELESWYFAQFHFVKQIYKVKLPKNNRKGTFKHPEKYGAYELEKFTNGEYKKIDGSRRLGLLLDPDSIVSSSFRLFVSTVREINEGLSE
ncbi:MAG: DUF4276 family protein [Planctomycetia bacterium]|nr:DUF4276 family protein [Planctomycetia bacterium]